MVTLSTTLHVIAGAVVMVLPAVLPRPAGPTWDNVFPGLIVNLPPASPAPPAATPAAEATTAKARPAPPPEPDPPPPPPKKKAPQKKKPPAAEPEPPKPRTPPREATSSSTAEKPTPELLTDTASAIATTSTTPTVGAGETADATRAGAGIGLSFGGTSFGYSYYQAQLINKLRAHWRRPVHAGSGETVPAVRIIFTIGRGGQVSGARIETPSSLPSLDRSALRAVTAAAPFPPLPPQFTEDALHVAITFTLEPAGL